MKKKKAMEKCRSAPLGTDIPIDGKVVSQCGENRGRIKQYSLSMKGYIYEPALYLLPDAFYHQPC